MPPDDPSNPDDEYEIVYPDGMQGMIEIEAYNYPASFGYTLCFIENGVRRCGYCSATMITPSIAVTAAHCILPGWDGTEHPE